LDELKDDDAEMLQIYVGRSRTRDGRSVSVGSSNMPALNVTVDDDAESGKGPSLPMSPESVEGAIDGPLYNHPNFRYVTFVFDLSNAIHVYYPNCIIKPEMRKRKLIF
jgi:hypothetical protein